jgi:hypothetical protein
MDPIIFAQLNEAYHKGVYVQEETLSEEECLDIQEWVEALIDEGYDLDEYSDEELYEAYLAESRGGKANSPDPISMPPSFHKLSRGLKKIKGNKPLWDKEGTQTGRFHTMQLKKRGQPPYNEELDLYDLVSEYLVSEGFCDSYEDADVIMANMSEEWREGIVEEVLDEALTGYRGKRAFTKFQDQNFRPDQYKKPSASKNPSPNYTLGAVGRHKEGSPNPYNPATPEDYRDTGNRPTKRGGRGKRGEAKTGYYGVDKRDSDRGRGNASKRRMGL